MSAPSMTVMRCTIHNIHFGAESSVDAVLVRCPRCAGEQIAQLHREVAVLTEHRNLLLGAIDLKRTLEPVATGNAS